MPHLHLPNISFVMLHYVNILKVDMMFMYSTGPVEDIQVLSLFRTVTQVVFDVVSSNLPFR